MAGSFNSNYKNLVDAHFLLIEGSRLTPSFVPYAAPELFRDLGPTVRLHGLWQDPVTHQTLDEVTTSAVTVYDAAAKTFQTSSGSLYHVVTVSALANDDDAVSRLLQTAQRTCGPCQRLPPSTTLMQMHDRGLFRVQLPDLCVGIAQEIQPFKRLRTVAPLPNVEVLSGHSLWEQLTRSGYVVLPCPQWLQQQDTLRKMPTIFATVLANMPEFVSGRTPDADKFTMGGFSAFNNPSSFHNGLVRRMRQYALYELFQLFQAACGQLNEPSLPKYNLEQLIDRMMLRPKGRVPSSESWHRDEAPHALEDDHIFGGWWNLDQTNQYFSCVAGSHNGTTGNCGFSKITDQQAIESYKAQKVKVEIPPGGILIFYERIVHEVLAKKAQNDMHRLFLGWRLTRSTQPLYDVTPLLRSQAVVPLKSGQIPKMYAQLHWTNWRQKIVEFSTNVLDVCTEIRTVRAGKDAGRSLRVVHQHMRSLEEYGLQKYPAYKANEVNMHIPGQCFQVRSNGTSQKVNLALY